MKISGSFAVMLLAVTAFAASSQAAVVVNDFFSDGTRNDPASPVYSENGVDVDLDGNIESALLTNNATNVTTTPGAVAATLPATSSSQYYTYFTTPNNPVTLNIGDTIKITLAFIPQGVTTTTSTTTSLRAGFYNSANTRNTADGSITGTNYRGYALFSQFSTTLGTTPLTFNKRTGFSNADPLNASADETAISTNRGAAGPGFTSGTSYLLTLTATRTDATSMQINASFTDANGNPVVSGLGLDTDAAATTNSTFAFDTFELRPGNSGTLTAVTALTFTNFGVEYIPVPEPSTNAMLTLAAVGVGAGATLRRRMV